MLPGQYCVRNLGDGDAAETAFQISPVVGFGVEIDERIENCIGGRGQLDGLHDQRETGLRALFALFVHEIPVDYQTARLSTENTTWQVTVGTNMLIVRMFSES